MTIALDASVLVAWLAEAGEAGEWARGLVAGEALVAPHLVLAESANVLRRAAVAGRLSDDAASLAYGELLATPIRLLPYEPFATRIWSLRGSVTPYDAWYVAVAEALEVPLATLDARLVAANGPRCRFSTFP